MKHAQSTSVRELIQKIENHTDRHVLQQDLRQNQTKNQFSSESKNMIQDVGNHRIMWITRNGTQNALHSVFIMLEYRHCPLHVRAFLGERHGGQSKIVKYTMDLLSPPECVIEKGRLHGHRYGKKSGDKKYYLTNQKKYKKRQFQGIHDRFLLDPEFRIDLIEHHRDEEVCRRWDALADEDHIHHLTVQEYFHYKNKRWLHSNKQGSDTMSLRHRSVFKQALSTV